ncbi:MULTISPECIES: phospholipase D-like domain-containing protein [unclassified Rhizobium]|uniref:phospholipase D-like domain-containing protein n=1 Tax=unclassified Rhizobium TaxID=2613769 RepID=UPI0007F0838D|nr:MULTISPECIES: phospholipase D-like domain-containing protein [unclassified Rhizobium]ANL10327.1 phospholipase D-like domain-containing protein [Rhizobium sp. N1341]ANM41081.1 phospholipase D-like domain-containing protein [Rhizobium sp. N741]
MSLAGAKNHVISVAAHRGDAKTLLAFDILHEEDRKGLSGFTVRVKPEGLPSYYLLNDLRFEHPEVHARDASEADNSTMNAPIRKFRWLHVPGQDHQGLDPKFGKYTYTVTPRYFDDDHRLKVFDPALSVDVDVQLAPFTSKKLKVGFTRGFVQSQAFARHFGISAKIRPSGNELLFDTNSIAGNSPERGDYTFADEYRWSGYTARQRIFEILEEVKEDPASKLDVFAYDLNEPDVMKALIKLGNRVRILLDNAALHHNEDEPTPEDRFEAEFAAAAGDDAIKRGKFGRYAHHKVFIVSKHGVASKVLTGSTNLSVTGVYVNSNHVLVYDDPKVAGVYSQVFEEAWRTKASSSFKNTALANKSSVFDGEVPATSVTFAPHTQQEAEKVLGEVIARIEKEVTDGGAKASVLFAVMELDSKTPNPVYEVLNAIHSEKTIFSFGISDNPKGISLYKIGSGEGVLVTGKPGKKTLPPPFEEIRYVSGVGHQVHHKFVVCGFRGDDPVVFCGSSNLALGGEQKNGDNLLAIRDADVATVFAIEAIGLIDHFNFLNGLATPAGSGKSVSQLASKREAAVQAEWFLSTSDVWVAKYFDENDLRCKDRQLFAL